MMKRLLNELIDTARVKPAEHSLMTSPNRIRSLGYALAGWLYMLRHQKNIRLQTLLTAALFMLALWLDIHTSEWALLILAAAVVWIAEFINAALEAAVNLAIREYHPMAKVAKDVAAAAVLLAVLTLLLVAGFILGPPLFAKLNPAAPF